jgi:hypothetical protein
VRQPARLSLRIPGPLWSQVLRLFCRKSDPG